MTMRPALRNFALLVHIVSSVGWIGAVVSFLVLSITGLNSQDPLTVRSAYLMMDAIAAFAIVPLSVASLASGLVQSLGTHWGLFRHYWVLVKFLLTLLAVIVLLLQLEPIGYIAAIAAETTLSGSDLREARLSLAVHAGAGLVTLLFITTLSVYKPKGLTRYGWRKQTG